MRRVIDVQKVYGDYLRNKNEEEGPKPTACGTMFRISDSGNCLRQRAFSAAKFPEVHQFSDQNLLAFAIGTHMHEAVQEACLAKLGGEYETAIDLSSTGVSLSGSCDGVIEFDPGYNRLLEIKTMSGFGFKLAKESDLPKLDHLTQASLYALGLFKSGTPVQEIHMVYIAKESDFRSGTKQGDTLEWVIPFDEPIEPYGKSPHEYALEELERFRTVQADLGAGVISEPIVYDDQLNPYEVTDPPGYMAKKGQPWNCRYCRYNEICKYIGPGQVDIGVARYHANNLAEELV